MIMNIQANFDVLCDLLHDAHATEMLANALEHHKTPVKGLKSTQFRELFQIETHNHYLTVKLIDTAAGVEVQIS